MSISNLWFPYAQMRTMPNPLQVVAANGAEIHLSDGRTLLDAISSWWCVIHGYNHPELNQAMIGQVEKFSHVMLGGLSHRMAEDLASTLCSLAPKGLQHVFFADSGSVGMEVAMKMAVQFWTNRGTNGRHRFLALRRAYHGDTTGVMSIGDPEEGMHHLFSGYLPKQIFVRPPEGFTENESMEMALDELRQALRRYAKELAAMVVEPIMQGAGGFNFYPPRYLQEARRLCNEAGVLLIFDEVATGFGRTGKLFAAEHAGVSPDIMVLAKGLTAGYLGMSATLASDRVYEAFLGSDYSQAFMHGPTFMGHATACAVALKSLEIFQRENYLQKIARIQEILCEELLSLQSPKVRATRVLGAVGVVQVHRRQDYEGIQEFAAKRGVWLRPFEDVVYTAPPYIIQEDQLRKITKVMREWFLK